jgi:hypothetical protein
VALCTNHSLTAFHGAMGGMFECDPPIYVEPITDMDKACDDFIRTRMGGVGISGDSTNALLPTNKGQK